MDPPPPQILHSVVHVAENLTWEKKASPEEDWKYKPKDKRDEPKQQGAAVSLNTG